MVYYERIDGDPLELQNLASPHPSMASVFVDQSATKRLPDEQEGEALLPPLLCPAMLSGRSSSGVSSRQTSDYVSTCTRGGEAGAPADLHDYLEVDVLTRLRDLQSEIDVLKNSLQTSGNSSKSKDSCIYEKIPMDIKSRPSRPPIRTPTQGKNFISQEAKSRGFYRLNHIWDSEIKVHCRFIWFVLLLGSLTLAVYHISERVMHYQTHPSHIHTDRRPVKELVFPAVTICNLNPYRLTEVAKLHLYGLVYSMQHNSVNTWKLDMRSYNNQLNKTYLQFLKETAHEKDKLVHRCQWQQETCDEESFSVTYTDYGLCYTFKLADEARRIDRSGPLNGLFLVLNVEQYEYVLGPMSAVGVAVALHTPDEAPLQFVQVPVGKYTSMEITKMEYSSLSSDTSRCYSEGPPASRKKCVARCREVRSMRQCDCALPSHTTAKDHYPACRLYDYVKCVLRIRDRGGDQCRCTNECGWTEYKSLFSYATIPKYGAESEVRKLRHNSEMEQQFRKALDTYHRVDHVISDYDNTTLINLARELYVCENASKTFTTFLVKYEHDYETTLSNLERAFQKFNHTVTIQFPFFKQNRHIGFGDFIFYAKDTIGNILKKETSVLTQTSVTAINSTLWYILWELRQVVNTSESTDYSTPLLSEVEEGVLLFRKELLNGYGQKYEEFRLQKSFYDNLTQKILNITRSLSSYLLTSYKRVKVMAKHRISIEHHFKSNLRDFFRHFRKETDSRTADLTEQLDIIRQAYSKDRHTIMDVLKGVNTTSRFFTSRFKNSKHNLHTLRDLVQGFSDELSTLRKYLKGVADKYIDGDFGKIELGTKISAELIRKEVSSIKTSVHEITVISDSMASEGVSLVESLGSISGRLIEFGLLDSRAEAKRAMAWLTFKPLIKEVKDLSGLIDGTITSITSYQREIMGYTTGRKLDENFFRNNFLYLDIYFKDMSETVRQHLLSYSLLDLACDIGGICALYLGASILTIFEFLDFMTRCSKHAMCSKKQN